MTGEGTREPEFEDIPVSPGHAVAALRWGATEHAPERSDYVMALDAVLGLEAGPDGKVTRAEVVAAAREYVPEPGTAIHGWSLGPVGSLGCYVNRGGRWTVAGAVAMAREPGAACAWTDGMYAHDMKVTDAQGRTVLFHALCPERASDLAWRERLCTEIAGHAEDDATRQEILSLAVQGRD